jgi:hypothetical protein
MHTESEDTTYFGLWSANQRLRVVELLSSLGVRFHFVDARESEDRLRAWEAWDESSAGTLTGYELFVRTADLDKLSMRLVEMFPKGSSGQHELGRLPNTRLLRARLTQVGRRDVCFI